MSVTLLLPYEDFVKGQIVSLGDEVEASLIQQGIAVAAPVHVITRSDVSLQHGAPVAADFPDDGGLVVDVDTSALYFRADGVTETLFDSAGVDITGGTIDGVAITATSYKLPSLSTGHSFFGAYNFTGNYGTAGTLTGITGATHGNTTLDGIPANTVANGSYITVSGETGAFRVVSGGGTASFTLNRAASTSTAGHTIQYIQVADDVMALGYNVGPGADATKPTSSLRFEADYLETDGYRYFETYIMAVNAAGTKQRRSFFSAFNLDTEELAYTYLRAGTGVPGNSAGYFIKNAADTRNLLTVTDGTTEGAFVFDGTIETRGNTTNTALFSIYGTENGANNGFFKFDLVNASGTRVTFGAIGVNNSVRTAGNEQGKMSFYIADSGTTGTGYPWLVTTGTKTALGAAQEFIVPLSASPTSSGTGTAGRIVWDASYIYVCTATNTWKRAALTGGY